jgi:N-acetylglucosamine malate deacetylase 1
MVLKSNVLIAVGAHPDDIELGCGGTISSAASAGTKVIAIYLTKGEKSGNPETRMSESKEALSILGVKDTYFGNFTDAEIPSTHEVVNFLENLYEKYKPDAV